MFRFGAMLFGLAPHYLTAHFCYFIISVIKNRPWRNAVAGLQTTATTQRWRSGFYMAACSGRFPRNVM